MAEGWWCRVGGGRLVAEGLWRKVGGGRLVAEGKWRRVGGGSHGQVNCLYNSLHLAILHQAKYTN